MVILPNKSLLGKASELLLGANSVIIPAAMVKRMASFKGKNKLFKNLILYGSLALLALLFVGAFSVTSPPVEEKPLTTVLEMVRA